MFQQRDALSNTVKALQGQKAMLIYEVDNLKKEKEKLEAAIKTGKTLLEQTLAQSLMNLKLQGDRPVHSKRNRANSFDT